MTGRRWRQLGRIAAATLGLGCLLATLTPPLADAMTFDRHAVRHLLLAMVAPLAFALSTPITFALRTLPHRLRRILLALLRSRLARALSTAPVVLALDVGGMYAFYLTPLYSATHERPWLNALVDAHMFLAGCLLSWYLVGRDPMPSPPSTRTRLIVLLLAAGSHDLLAKLMYAQHLPAHGGSTEQLQLGAQIMFYGGDVVEVALAVLVLANWYARTGRQLRQTERQHQRQAERRARTGEATPRRLGSPLPQPDDPG
ncbi:MAG TPA: cytochrome c oxidase assembly protein [Kineosporiaceae bacterium]|nr:cytochrome c oxidase assembly protein [Kineosporiaceae bacterium]